MSETVDIGAARVRLIVDAADFQAVIEQGKSAVRGFGSEAQTSYDKTEKSTRRAANALLDYVNSLGRADTALDKYVRNASRMGVEKSVIDAATLAWGQHTDKVQQDAAAQDEQAAATKRAAAAYKELISTQAQSEAQAKAVANAAAESRFNNLAAAHAAQSQLDINKLVAPGLSIDPETIAHRLNSESAFSSIIEQENELLAVNAQLEKQAQEASVEASRRAAAGYAELLSVQAQEEQQLKAIANAAAQARIEAQQQQHAANVQQDTNALVAPGLTSSSNTQQRHSDAEVAFGPLIDAQDAKHVQDLANAYADFNRQLGLGIHDQEKVITLAQARANATEAFLPQIKAEIAAEQQAEALQASQASFIKQLENTQQAAGKTYYELLHIKAAELGISEAADPLINKLKQTNQAMGAGTISAKQYEFAVRGLPAQFTDVFVSLAAGQNPLTVLLQQGGQAKDMFGGIKTAVVAVGKELGKIVTNPWILLASALAAVAVSAYQASERMTDLAIATAKGDLIAGSAKNLSALAESLNDLKNINLASADAAVSSLAEAGLLTGKNFKLAAEASARWATITGEGADKVASKFNQIARDPMAAIIDGTLRITDAQYQQLVALERLGDKQGEVNLAVQIYFDQINNNSQSVREELTATAKAWQDIKDSITSAWHALGKYRETSQGAGAIGLSMSAGAGSGASTVAAMQAQAMLAAQQKAANDAIGGGRGKINPDTVKAAATLTLTLDQIAANRENQKALDDLGTKTEKYDTQLKLLNGQLSRSSDEFLKQSGIIREAGGAFSGAGYQKLVNGLRLKVFGQNEGGDPTRPIKEWEKTALDAIKNVQQAGDYLYQDQLLSAEDYYDKSKSLAADEEDVQLTSISRQIAALRGRANSEAQIQQLEQQRYTVRLEASNRIAKLDRDEELAVRARTAAYRDYLQALGDANDQLERQGAQSAAGVGQGSREAALQQAKDNARYAAQLRDRATDQALSDKTISQTKADDQRAASATALSTQLFILQNNYDSLKEAESDYLNGSKKAWADWATNVQNNAAFMQKATTQALDGVSDSLANLISTGKSGFKDFLESLSKMIIEFGLKQAALSAVNGYGGGGGFGGAINGILGLLKTGNTGSTAASSGSSDVFNLASFTSLALGSAKGNAFGGGSLAAYRNSIVSQPTFFPFAKGGVPNVGLMGEKSGASEAIMPLTRTRGGELAVKTTGATSKTVNVNQTFVVPGAVNRSTQDQIAARAYSAGARAARRG